MNYYNSCLEAALYYRSLGFSIIPIASDKRPFLRWYRYQKEKADEKTIRDWWKQWPDANVGIVTGAISGIVVVDVEKGGSTNDLSPTVMSQTGGGGWHFYYRHPGGVIENKTRIRELTDIRGDGGYVIAPPSLHLSGSNYAWAAAPEDAEFAEPPSWIVQQSSVHKEKDWSRIISGVPAGERNADLTALAGKLAHHLPIEEWNTFLWPILEAVNERNVPPIGRQELAGIYASITQREVQRQEKNSDPDPTPRIWTLQEMFAMDFGEEQWLIEHLLPLPSMSALSGNPGNFKTWLTMELARCVALGLPFLGQFPAMQGAVLIVDEEKTT